MRRLPWLILVLAVGAARCGACTPDPVHPLAIQHHDIGIQYLQQGQCLEAEERCRLALEYAPSFEHPHNCLGMIEIQCRNDLDKAAQHFKDALAINSDFAEAHNNLGAVFFRKNPPDYDKACDEFKAAIEIDPGFQDGRENYGMCLMRQGTIAGDSGNTELRTERYKDARSHLIRLLEQNPANANARHHLGFMDLNEKRYESAEQNFKRCLEIDSENPTCCFNLAQVYLETARCEDAIQAYVCVLRGGGGASEVAIGARSGLGSAYEMCAKKDGAIMSFLDKIKADPGNPKHHFDLGNIYADKGLWDQAVNEWENTVKLDPLYCAAYNALAQVANKNLDSAVTIRRCQDFVSCVTERGKNEPVDQFSGQVEQCKALVRKLEME
ncbi:MAG: tetratricopeptide repeat protein [Deltaproteobacteria bacterium]|nr:tetratricopeptide repeat protein [Deltaproteobacteria bacterium]